LQHAKSWELHASTNLARLLDKQGNRDAARAMRTDIWVWRRAGLKPHRIERYMASDDPDFELKAADIIGLYVKPPQHAAVFCVDEKTAIQALYRLDPV